MRDNLSVIIAVIIGVIVIVFIPVITILQYQNNVAYNMALSLTTEFVENIKQNGKITVEEYETFLEKLKTTSNSFKIELEAHKQQLVKGIDENGNPVVENISVSKDVDGDGVILEGEAAIYNSSIEYSDENLIHFTDEILQELYVGSDKNNNGTIEEDEKGIYPFEANDEIYINVYNTNITTLDRFTAAVFGTQIVNPKKINISLGGKIFGETQTSFMQTDFANAYAPRVEIFLPVKNEHNKEGWVLDNINIGQLASTDREYKKAMLSTINSRMQFWVAISNAKNFFRSTEFMFEKEDENGNLVFNKNAIILGGKFNQEIVNILMTFIQTNGFTASNIEFIFGGYDTRKDELQFKIYMSGIYLSNYEPDALFSLTIKPGLAAGVGNSLSASVTSEEFLIDVPNEDGPPKIHLTSLPSTIVDGDLVTFSVSATDMSGVSYFNFDKNWISGFSHNGIYAVNKTKSSYDISIFGIKEDSTIGNNIITIPAGAAMDYENTYSEEVKFDIGTILADTQKPEVSLTYKINDQNKNQIQTGDKFTLEIKIQDNSNSWIPNWLKESNNVDLLSNAIKFHQGYEEVKTIDGDTLNSKLESHSLPNYDFDSRTATIVLEIPSFPEVEPPRNGAQAFAITIPSGVVTDLYNNSNNSYDSQYITYNYFVEYITYLADGNNLKIKIETPKKIANIDELEASNVITLHHAIAETITITKIDNKSFEINISNIQVLPGMNDLARVDINKEVLKSEANELLPKSTKPRYLKNIPNLTLP